MVTGVLGLFAEKVVLHVFGQESVYIKTGECI